MKIAVACGGTGGHIFPGLAVAEILAGRGHTVTLWLAGRDVEQTSVSDWSGPVVRVRARGFSSRPGLSAIGVGLRLVAAVVASVRQMRADRPDVVLAMGSYASVGPVLAARLLRIPSVIHEANAVPGRAVTFLARFASRVAVGFQAATQHVHHRDVSVTGFPLRDLPCADVSDWPMSRNRFTVLVMGGSQGAHVLNEVASAAIVRLEESGRGVSVVHLAGSKDAETLRARYRDAHVPAMVCGFLREMGSAYDVADMAICRAGAASCAELAACCVPAVLVPLPTARRQHQLLNAQVMSAACAAETVPQDALTIARLTELIDAWRNDPARIDRMRAQLETIAVPDAAEQLANLVEATPLFRRTESC